jgi:alanyl-tRNA synthetase
LDGSVFQAARPAPRYTDGVTDRLYLRDPDLVEFHAHVVASRTLADRAAVVLDRTAFYPEGGGQPADHGTLGDVPVVDVREVDGELLHLLGGPAPHGEVVGRIDAARRLDHLQQHHGQHLLSAAFEAELGAATSSFHLGAEGCTIDLAIPVARLDAPALRAAEARANAWVFADLPVTARDFTPEEVAALPLRKEAVKGSRVVVVGDLATGRGGAATGFGGATPGHGIVDASPCGGTHPRRTGAVGLIAVLSAQKWGAGSRVEFACGGRVVRLVAERGERLASAAEALRCAPAEVGAAARRAAEDLSARRKEVERLAAALAEVEAARLAGAVPAGPIRIVLTPPGGGAAGWLRAVAQGLAARGRTALLGAVEDGRGVLCFARPRGPGPAMGELLREAVAQLGGKGGGSPELAQGGGPEGARLEAALDAAAKAL